MRSLQINQPENSALQTSTLKALLTSLERNKRDITLRTALTSSSLNIQNIIKDRSSVGVFASWVSLQILNLLNLISPDSAHHNEQTADAFGDDIIETRQDWKPEDVIMFCKFIRQESGAVNTRTLNILQLTDLLAQYEDKRAMERENIYREVKQQQMEQVNQPYAPSTQENLKMIYKTLEDAKEVEVKESVKRKPTEVDLLVQEWLKEFENGRNGRFIKYKGHALDINEYLEVRMNEHNNPVTQ